MRYESEPCIHCGAPIDENGHGHDEGCSYKPYGGSNEILCWNEAAKAIAEYRALEKRARGIASSLLEEARDNKRQNRADWTIPRSLNFLVEQMTWMIEGFSVTEAKGKRSTR
jgi:hypothetical protein